MWFMYVSEFTLICVCASKRGGEEGRDKQRGSEGGREGRREGRREGEREGELGCHDFFCSFVSLLT